MLFPVIPDEVRANVATGTLFPAMVDEEVRANLTMGTLFPAMVDEEVRASIAMLIIRRVMRC